MGSTINGSAGNDWIRSGSSDDSITSNGGNDTINSGAGNDTIDSGTGNDSVLAGDGQDTVSAGDGSDTIFGEGGDDTLDGGAGDDQIFGGTGNDSITGGAGRDTIYAEGGNDTIDAGSDDDIVYGESGQDNIEGGDGNDTLYGAGGRDTISGGAGNDQLFGGADADTFVIRDDGGGIDSIEDFNIGDGDIISLSFAELSVFSDIEDRMTFEGGHTVITFDSGQKLIIRHRSPNDFSASQFRINTGPVCLTPGTRVATPCGIRDIADLARGDLVTTRDHGTQPVKDVFRQIVRFVGGSARGKPIEFKPGCLGHAQPIARLVTSPQHHILMQDVQGPVLVPAVKLTRRAGVRRMQGRRTVVYINLLFDRHEVICAEGIWVESLRVTKSTQQCFAALRARSLTDPAYPVVRKAGFLSPPSLATASPICPNIAQDYTA